jgi:hypothetical protein
MRTSLGHYFALVSSRAVIGLFDYFAFVGPRGGNWPQGQPYFHNFTSGPFAPSTGSVVGSLTFGIVSNALA